jgi:predicted Zn-dependent peptidase
MSGKFSFTTVIFNKYYMVINLKSETDLSGFYIVYEGSVNIEESGVYGISHLMEHLLCKTFEHLQDEFETYGIDWNAYTSGNEIVFHFTGLDDNLKGYRKELVELISNFTITKEQFKNEKKIVIEEYKDTFNDQATAHYLNLDRKLFGLYDPIGLKSDLEKLTYLDCINFFEKQFMNPTKVINVSKNSDFKFDVDFNDAPEGRDYEFLENNDVDLELGNDFKNKSSVICLSPFIEDDFQYVHFINYMLSSGLNSPIYKEVREKRQLVYSISCSMRRLNKKGINYISTVTANDNAPKVIETLDMIFKNRDKYLTKDRFDIIKESLKVNLAKQEINRFSSVGRWISPEDYSMTPEFIDKVKFEKCKEVFDKYFNFDDYYKSIDKEEFGGDEKS